MNQLDPDAMCLRESASILRKRTRKRPFLMMVLIHLLEQTADRIEKGAA